MEMGNSDRKALQNWHPGGAAAVRWTEWQEWQPRCAPLATGAVGESVQHNDKTNTPPLGCPFKPRPHWMRREKGSKLGCIAPCCNNSSVHIAQAKQHMMQQASEWDLAPFFRVASALRPVWTGPKPRGLESHFFMFWFAPWIRPKSYASLKSLTSESTGLSRISDALLTGRYCRYCSIEPRGGPGCYITQHGCLIKTQDPK